MKAFTNCINTCIHYHYNKRVIILTLTILLLYIILKHFLNIDIFDIAHSVKNNIIKYLLYQKNESQITKNV